MSKLVPTNAVLKAGKIANQLAEIDQLRDFLNTVNQYRKDLYQIQITGYFQFPGGGENDPPEKTQCCVPVSLVLKLVDDYHKLMVSELEKTMG